MFEQIRNTLGNMDGQYQDKTPVRAFITDVKEVEYSQKTGKPGQSLYLRHNDTGEIAWVKLTGNFTALTTDDKGTVRDFLIWPYKPPQSSKTYLYGWIQNAPQTPQGAERSKLTTNTNNVIDLLTNIYGVSCKILVILEKETSFEKKYDIPPENEPEVEDDTVPW